MPTAPIPEGLFDADDGQRRCQWCAATPAYRAYHDTEWGQPVADDRRLFEKLCLEGFQAGLSWLTILNKREAFRRAFANFDARKMARFDDADVARLVADAGIVRHRGKIEAVINNARQMRALQDEFGSFAAYVWRFEPEPRTRPARPSWAQLRAMTTVPESVALSKDLLKRGFRFVGPTTMYAFMQAMGLVNDHVHGCHVRDAVAQARKAFTVPGR